MGYRFNGKELDQETGYAYYGARYYDNELSLWLSVDAMAMSPHNMPLTPYHFSVNNPVSIIDPDGNDWYRNDKSGSYTWREGDGCIEGYTHVGAEYTECAANGNQLEFTSDKKIYYTTNDNEKILIRDYDEPQNWGDRGGDINVDALLEGDAENDVVPSIYDYKNGEEVSINRGENYFLMENEWIPVANSGEYAENVA
ncbi:MAG: hypothetical protein HWE24_20675 [Oceanospirillaceae bacterium]|nr:hypothetical protein [Oceanospirillaceae bacterium]